MSEPKTDNVVYGTSFYLAAVLVIWIGAAISYFVPVPSWMAVPLLISVPIPIVLIATYIAWWLRKLEEEDAK